MLTALLDISAWSMGSTGAAFWVVVIVALALDAAFSGDDLEK